MGLDAVTGTRVLCADLEGPWARLRPGYPWLCLPGLDESVWAGVFPEQSPLFGGPWLGRLDPVIQENQCLPPQLIRHGSQARERSCSVLPSSLSAGPESVEQCRGGPSTGRSKTLFQALFSPCTGLAVDPQLCVGSWLSNVTDLLPTKEWTVPMPWKSPAFSWPGLGGCGDSARLTESSFQGPRPVPRGVSGPLLHTVAWVTLSPAVLAPTCEMSPEATHPAACLQAPLTRGLVPEQSAAPPPALAFRTLRLLLHAPGTAFCIGQP